VLCSSRLTQDLASTSYAYERLSKPEQIVTEASRDGVARTYYLPRLRTIERWSDRQNREAARDCDKDFGEPNRWISVGIVRSGSLIPRSLVSPRTLDMYLFKIRDRRKIDRHRQSQDSQH
jgi:hypothetical protein